MKFLSIIIPVFNTEKYLSACFDSIMYQNIDKSCFEIIAINDGSTDSSGDLLNEYASKYDNIKVIHKANGGVSVARNIGIENATGEYLMFVDSDDQLAQNSLEYVIGYLNANRADILIGRSFIYYDGKLEKEHYSINAALVNKVTTGYDLYVKYSYLRGSVCGCVFKQLFITNHQIKFEDGLKNGEDSLFCTESFMYAGRIGLSDIVLYLINERPGSASRNWTFERASFMINNLKVINRKLENKELTREQLAILNFCLYNTISAIFNSCHFSVKQYIEIRRKIKSLIKTKIDVGKIKICKRKIGIFNASIDLYAFLVVFKNKLKIV